MFLPVKTVSLRLSWIQQAGRKEVGDKWNPSLHQQRPWQRKQATHERQLDVIIISVHEFYVQNMHYTWQLYTATPLLVAGKGQE